MGQTKLIFFIFVSSYFDDNTNATFALLNEPTEVLAPRQMCSCTKRLQTEWDYQFAILGKGPV